MLRTSALPSASGPLVIFKTCYIVGATKSKSDNFLYGIYHIEWYLRQVSVFLWMCAYRIIALMPGIVWSPFRQPAESNPNTPGRNQMRVRFVLTLKQATAYLHTLHQLKLFLLVINFSYFYSFSCFFRTSRVFEICTDTIPQNIKVPSANRVRSAETKRWNAKRERKNSDPGAVNSDSELAVDKGTHH